MAESILKLSSENLKDTSSLSSLNGKSITDAKFAEITPETKAKELRKRYEKKKSDYARISAEEKAEHKALKKALQKEFAKEIRAKKIKRLGTTAKRLAEKGIARLAEALKEEKKHPNKSIIDIIIQQERKKLAAKKLKKI